MKPLIGITTSLYFHPQKQWDYHRIYSGNVYAVEKAGGLPVLIPINLDDANLRGIYERLDGVMIPGGEDVNPQSYNAERHATVEYVDDRRDHAEMTLARWAVEDDKPLLGVCRGMQVVNVALGGSLIQDIATFVKTDITHNRYPSPPHNALNHNVTLAADSKLASIVGTSDVVVNSLHHQTVENVAPGAWVTAQAPDGLIEAIEFTGKQFALCVQWHPEMLIAHGDDDAAQRIFEAFVQAAANA